MKKLSLILVALLLVASFVTAQWNWVCVDGVSKKPTPIQVKVVTATAKELKLELTVPGYLERKVKLTDGTEVVMIHIPETARTMERGFPMLPLFSKAIKLESDRCQPTLTVVAKEEASFKLALPVIPSKGHFTRDIPEDSVAFEFGPVYKQDVFWPEKDQFQLGKPFILSEVHGSILNVLPIRANHVQMLLKVITKATLVITCEEKNMVRGNSQIRKNPSKAFKRMTSDFIGYEEASRGEVPAESNKKLVVVTPADFEGLLGNWINWKRQNGWTVTVKTINSSMTATNIKSSLQDLYNDVTTRFGYVVLIGDAAYNTNFEVAQPMPTFKGSKEGAAADRVYVRLAGNDNYPDAFISRISGNATEITNQLNKIVAYEQGVSGTWLNRGLLIASDQGSPIDYERTNWIEVGGGQGQKVPIVTGGLKGFGITFSKQYDPSASASGVASAVNAGLGIICYIGHGSSTSWGTTGFSTSNVSSLSNGAMQPVIWSVACVNGDFLKTNNCFAEAWLRKANGGAVAMEAASTNESWVPPCDKQAATVNAIINKKYSTFGALECEGVVAGLKNWGDANSTEGNKMAEQCNLFGDCTMLVRTKAPTTIQATLERGLDNNIVFNVLSEDRAVEEATVTVYNKDFSIMVTGETVDGQVNIILPAEAANAELFYTIVGQDLTPVIDQPLN